MLAAARCAFSNRIQRVTTVQGTTRSLARVVPAPTRSSKPQTLARILREKVPVKEDHGLYGFFRKKENSDELTGEGKYEVFEDQASKSKQTGRSWRASELRLKSFSDLHTLWYILLRERNLLATQKEETRRMGVMDTASQISLTRLYHTRKSMARIKAVLNERRLAYEGAVKLVEGERDEKIDEELRNAMMGDWRRQVTKEQHLKKRKVYLARRREQQQKATAASKTPTPTPQRIAGLLVNA
ncbi:hypothetical protein H0H92_006541 [Tricholoma furcatifolium]|nr:hypothetical protein H0H92_006541 [Tricholoma furcatifolium]